MWRTLDVATSRSASRRMPPVGMFFSCNANSLDLFFTGFLKFLKNQSIFINSIDWKIAKIASNIM